MEDRKDREMKEAMETILDTLNDADFIEFSERVRKVMEQLGR